MTQRPLPLSGVRILDLTRLLPGPMASLQLADLGAEVIKVENPQEGDYGRTMGVTREKTAQLFLAINRNKRFVTLDLKESGDLERFLGLVRTVDVLIEGFRPGVMDRLGLGWDRLSRENPRLVYCSLSGYGQTGPMRERAGHDINYIGYTGMLEQTVGRDGTPAIPALQIADLLGGAQNAVIGILAALLDARTSGRGRHVDISMTDGVFAHNVVGIAQVNARGVTAEPGHDLLTGGVPCYNIYRTSDGRHMAVGALEAKFWDCLCEAIGRADLKPAHWSRGQKPGSAEALAVRGELDAIFRTRSMDEWTERLSGLDCCTTPVLRTDEALSHPLFLDRHMVVEQTDAIEGTSRFATSPIQFSEPPSNVGSGAKEAGADNAAVLPARTKPR